MMNKEQRSGVLGDLPDIDGTLAGGATVPKGDWQVCAMPDTLDLAEHARLAVNALTNLRPDYFYGSSVEFVGELWLG